MAAGGGGRARGARRGRRGVRGDGGDAVPRADRLRGLEPALRRRCRVDRDPVLVLARHRRQPLGVGAWASRSPSPAPARRASRGRRATASTWCGSTPASRRTASSAAYVYQPEATSDAGLTGIGAQDPLDHVLVCFDPEQPATTAPPVTEPTAAATDRAAAATDRAAHHGAADHPAADRPAAAAPPPPPTTEPPTVLSVPAQTPTTPGQATPRQAPPQEAPPRVVTPAPATAVMLPKTGSVTAPLVGVGRVAGGPGPRDAGLRPTVVAERRRGLISSARGEGSAPARR